MAVMAEPSTDLAVRLADARAAEAPLVARAAELEAALADAIARSNFLAADDLKAELATARQAAAISSATAQALAGALAAIEHQRIEDDRAIQLQRQRDAARQRAGEVSRLLTETLDGLHHHIAAARAALDGVRMELQLSVRAEDHASNLQAELENLQVTLGEREPGGRHLRPNAATATIEADPLLIAIYRNSEPAI